MSGLLLHTVDVLVCAILIRLILGWLFSYRKLVRLVFTLILLGAATLGIWYLDLPLSKFLCVILLIPIVILLVLSFLPELGRAYAAASRGNIFRVRIPHYADLIPELVGACWDLKQNRRGAIIVLQRKESVSEMITGGEPVDAIVGRSLLLSIFDPHSPGHDGAAVIKGNRVDVIGAVLPLPANEHDLPSELGTRHLAAVGLSERCDADIFVVSEERGTISHVNDGELKVLKVQNPDDLRVELNKIVGGDATDGHEKGENRRSLALWIFAVLIAMVGTFAIKPAIHKIMGSEMVYNSADVKVSLTGLAPQVYQESISQDIVKLYFRAPSGLVSSASMEGIQVRVNMADLKVGANTITLTKDMIKGLPSTFIVDKFTPDSITVQTAYAREMEFQIEPRLVGLARKFRYAVVSVTPAQFRASVRQSSLKLGNIVNTTPIDLSNVRTPGIFKYETTADLPPSVKPTSPSSLDKVTVELEIAPR